MLNTDDLKITFTRKAWASPERVTDEKRFIPAASGTNYVIHLENTSTKRIDWLKADVGLIHSAKVRSEIQSHDLPTAYNIYSGVEQFTIDCGALPAKNWSWQALRAADFGRSIESPSDNWVLLRVYGQCEGRTFVVHVTQGYLPPPSRIYDQGMSCFIAHAAFKDTHHPTVTELRRARDEVLKRTRLGRRFVRFYYRHSPRIAAAMADRPVVQATTRGLLTPLAHGIRFSRAISRVVRNSAAKLLNCSRE